MASFSTMTTSRDTPNPLRPYYVPPSIGIPPDAHSSSASGGVAGSSLGTSARDMLSDLDYGAPFFDREGPSLGEMGKKLVDRAIWKYTSVLLAQPFDVAKTILQVRLAAAHDADTLDTKTRDDRRRSAVLSRDRSSTYDREHLRHASETESDDDEPSYFTSSRPARYVDDSPSRRHGHDHARRRQATPPSRSRSATPVPSSSSSASSSPYTPKLNLRRPDSVLETLSQLWQHSGATGLWKATNATFIYNVLVKALEGWTRSLLCALLNLPDPSALAGGPSEIVAAAIGGLDVADSPAPWASLGIAVAAAGIAGVLLSPLDMIRTRLILTPTTSAPRAILPCLRLLPTLTTPSSLLPATILHSSLPTLITTSTPLLLRQYLRIDPLTTPTSYSAATFLASTAELFLKLPVETVLRRGQVAALRAAHDKASTKARAKSAAVDGSAHEHEHEQQLATVVDVGAFNGVFGTMWRIVYDEGSREARAGAGAAAGAGAGAGAVSMAKPRAAKKGQGVQGLWRGWRVGMWGLVGVWGASAMGGAGGGAGGEF